MSENSLLKLREDRKAELTFGLREIESGEADVDSELEYVKKRQELAGKDSKVGGFLLRVAGTAASIAAIMSFGAANVAVVIGAAIGGIFGVIGAGAKLSGILGRRNVKSDKEFLDGLKGQAGDIRKSHAEMDEQGISPEDVLDRYKKIIDGEAVDEPTPPPTAEPVIDEEVKKLELLSFDDVKFMIKENVLAAYPDATNITVEFKEAKGAVGDGLTVEFYFQGSLRRGNNMPVNAMGAKLSDVFDEVTPGLIKKGTENRLVFSISGSEKELCRQATENHEGLEVKKPETKIDAAENVGEKTVDTPSKSK